MNTGPFEERMLYLGRQQYLAEYVSEYEGDCSFYVRNTRSKNIKLSDRSALDDTFTSKHVSK